MKKVIIFHGTDCSPESEYYWYAWLRRELENRGLEVDIPYYPDINREPIDTFLPKVLHCHNFDNDTILVGHSAGAPLILSILENSNVSVNSCVLVAGFIDELSGSTNPILQGDYDWQAIKQRSEKFVFINSVNDPWGCDDKQGRKMFDKLGGTQIIRQEGHFGSEGKNSAYVQFPLLRDIILEASV